MEDINSPVFAQAKIEYTKQLIDVLKLPIYEGLQKIYGDSKRIFADGYEDELPNIFRKNIENVPKWNTDIIENEVDRIIRVSNCDWLDDLITAVFISHTKILASLGNNSKRVNLTIPKTSNFIHKCYINSAREMWKNPYLFDESVSSSEYQKNIKYIEDLIKESIEHTIRKALPVKEILRDHFEHSELGEQNKMEIEKTKNLQKLLMKEIMETRKEKQEYLNNYNDNTDNNERYFDDHVNEKMIVENTKNLVVNDILSDNEDDVVEPYYENPDIVDTKPVIVDTPVTVEEKLNEYKGVLENKPEEVVVKKLDSNNNVANEVVVNDNVVANEVVVNDNVANDIIVNDNTNIVTNDLNNVVVGSSGNNDNNDNTTNNIVSDDTKNISMVESISETVKDDENIKTVGLGKVESVVEEVKVVDDKDETMTLDNFMNDVNDLLSDDKKNKDDFTLFNDAKDIES
tara:strand:+ start:25 stop:1401 length:1377 start_codon:yes stop_codon:yes gene_type:complete